MFLICFDSVLSGVAVGEKSFKSFLGSTASRNLSNQFKSFKSSLFYLFDLFRFVGFLLEEHSVCSDLLDFCPQGTPLRREGLPVHNHI